MSLFEKDELDTIAVDEKKVGVLGVLHSDVFNSYRESPWVLIQLW